MKNFNKQIDEFCTTDIKRSIVSNILENGKMSEVQKSYSTTRANVNLHKNNFIDFVYNTNRIFFSSIVNEAKKNNIADFKDFFNDNHLIIARMVLKKLIKKNSLNIIVSDFTLIKSERYFSFLNYIKTQRLPLEYQNIKDELSCNKDEVNAMVQHYSIKDTIYHNDECIFSLSSGAYSLADAFAKNKDADLEELYIELKKTVKSSLETLTNFNDFVSLINNKMTNRKTTKSLNNFLRVSSGSEGIVTRLRGLRMYKISELEVDRIVKNCIEYVKESQEYTNSVSLLARLKNEMSFRVELSPIFLKSLLVVSGYFEQGRKYNLVLQAPNKNSASIKEVEEQQN